MKRYLKAALIYLAWAFLLPVFMIFPHLPFALMRWTDEKWPT